MLESITEILHEHIAYVKYSVLILLHIFKVDMQTFL